MHSSLGVAGYNPKLFGERVQCSELPSSERMANKLSGPVVTALISSFSVIQLHRDVANAPVVGFAHVICDV